MRSPFTRFFRRAIEVCALIVVGCLLVGLAGRAWYLFDLLSHFRIQYLVCLTLAGLVLLVLRAWVSGTLCILAAALFAVPLAPYFRADKPGDTTPSLKLISYNVNTANRNHTTVRDYLRKENADIVFLMEVNDRWIASLSALADLYPHTLIRSREDNFGVALLSKHPFETASVKTFTEHALPTVRVEFAANNERFTLYGAHPLPPVGGYAAESRDRQLRLLAERIRADTGHLLFVGDFNLSQYSPHFAEILRQSGLKDSAIGFGLPPTWQSGIPFLALPIDQALVSDSISVLSRHTGPLMGSDHHPLVITIGTTK